MEKSGQSINSSSIYSYRKASDKGDRKNRLKAISLSTKNQRDINLYSNIE